MTSVFQANDADSIPVPRSSLPSNAGFRNFAPLAQTAGAGITTHPSWADAAEQVPPQPASCDLHPTKLRHEMKVVTASAHPMPEDVLSLRRKLLTQGMTDRTPIAQAAVFQDGTSRSNLAW